MANLIGALEGPRALMLSTGVYMATKAVEKGLDQFRTGTVELNGSDFVPNLPDVSSTIESINSAAKTVMEKGNFAAQTLMEGSLSLYQEGMNLGHQFMNLASSFLPEVDSVSESNKIQQYLKKSGFQQETPLLGDVNQQIGNSSHYNSTIGTTQLVVESLATQAFPKMPQLNLRAVSAMNSTIPQPLESAALFNFNPVEPNPFYLGLTGNVTHAVGSMVRAPALPAAAATTMASSSYIVPAAAATTMASSSYIVPAAAATTMASSSYIVPAGLALAGTAALLTVGKLAMNRFAKARMNKVLKEHPIGVKTCEESSPTDEPKKSDAGKKAKKTKKGKKIIC